MTKINMTADFMKWYMIEDMKQKRVGRQKFERLLHIVPVASVNDEPDLVSLICRIVQKEVHRVTNQADKPLNPFSQSLKETVQNEVEKILALVSVKLTDTQQ